MALDKTEEATDKDILSHLQDRTAFIDDRSAAVEMLEEGNLLPLKDSEEPSTDKKLPVVELDTASEEAASAVNAAEEKVSTVDNFPGSEETTNHSETETETMLEESVVLPAKETPDVVVVKDPAEELIADEKEFESSPAPVPLPLCAVNMIIPKEPSETTVVNNADAVQSSKPDGSSADPGLLSLTMDSLHCVASFLAPVEWSSFGLLNKSAYRVYRKIIRRVRMHGYLCATEIVSAWKLGQHADAKELAALYISSGVPVYPRSLGHSYHTLLWRMGVETREMQEKQQTLSPEEILENELPNNSPNTPNTTDPMDSFYAERVEFRRREGYSSQISYLEEKYLFFMKKNNESNEEGGRRRTSLNMLNPDQGTSSPTVTDLLSLSSENNGNVNQNFATVPKKLRIKVHQHLYDQHMSGRVYIDDEDGGMVTPPVSLTADFYHPTAHSSNSNAIFEMSNKLLSPSNSNAAEEMGIEPPLLDVLLDGLMENASVMNDNDDVRNDNDAFAVTPLVYRRASVLKQLDLDIYSSPMKDEFKTEEDVDGSQQEVKKHLRSRFATYQRRLEAFLVKGNSSGFDECILDFWDEFFPHTSNIQYYDRHTAVPRISRLHIFLTKPLPKSIGIVQCEIQRVKTSAKGKGVNVKGRLFPSYEYRLFIRNRPHQGENSISDAESADGFLRRDSVLMVAKNRGRNHVQASGAPPASTPTKKGSNNYYLYTAQQMDVDAHFNNVNDTEGHIKMNANGASHDPVLSDANGSKLLGRLQSNFIGTEFQIFTPHIRKRTPKRADSQILYLPSDGDSDYDSGVSSDNNSSLRSRRLRRSSLRWNNSGNIETPSSTLISTSIEEMPAPRGRKCRRTKSCPEFASHGRQPRTNRRAIANNATAPEVQQQLVLCEEEAGVITYTANLLGSRPRIMDVCIPKVTPAGVPATEWNKYLESCDDIDDAHMLTCFRLLRLHSQEQNVTDNANNNDNGDNDIDDNTNTIESESEENGASTPDDFGLIALQNRPPWWNVELGSFVLNFGGRVSVASVKNFQLCHRNDQDRIMLQFGRISGRHSFTMDFQHPLTAVQAFSIAISSLQSKISFG